MNESLPWIISVISSIVAVVSAISTVYNNHRRSSVENKKISGEIEAAKQNLQKAALDSALLMINPLKEDIAGLEGKLESEIAKRDDIEKKLNLESSKRAALQGCVDDLREENKTLRNENKRLLKLNTAAVDENKKLKKAIMDLVAAIRENVEARLQAGDDTNAVAADELLKSRVEEITKDIL